MTTAFPADLLNTLANTINKNIVEGQKAESFWFVICGMFLWVRYDFGLYITYTGHLFSIAVEIK